MENEIVYQKSYAQFKEECDTVVKQTAEGFVKLGYLLKVARDTDVLQESNYKTVAEFAEAEYGLSATYVSRFISINDRFAENGYSDKLDTKYQGFGYAKLSVMLQLPDEMNEELTPDMSKSDITTLKDEFDAEKHVSDIERMIEPQTEAPEMPMRLQLMYKTLYSLGESIPEVFIEVAKAEKAEDVESQLILAMAPSDTKVYSVRVMGLGRMMLTCSEDRVSIVNSRTGDKQLYTWAEVEEVWKEVGAIEGLPFPMHNPGERWEKCYGRKLEIAPVQEEPKKETKKKEPKVVKAKEEVTETVSEEDENKNFVSETEDEAETDGDNREHIVEAGEQATTQGIQDRPKEKDDNDSYDSEEVEDETDSGNSGEDDYSDEAENAIEVKTWAGDTIIVKGLIKETEVAAVENDPRKELQEDLKHYCKELVEASYWPVSEAERYRERSDELIDLILNARKDLLLMNFNLKNELDDEEDEDD